MSEQASDLDPTGGNLLPGEDESEKAARQLEELLTEVRVAMPGVQVLFAFLLAVPFQARFAEVDSTQKAFYIVTLLASGFASACFIAIASMHRILFRHRQREYIVHRGNRLVVSGLALLAVAMSFGGAFVMSFLQSERAGWITLAGGLILFFGLWFALPLARLRRSRRAR